MTILRRRQGLGTILCSQPPHWQQGQWYLSACVPKAPAAFARSPVVLELLYKKVIPDWKPKRNFHSICFPNSGCLRN